MYGGYTYLDPTYEPDENDFIVLAWVEGIKNIKTLAEAVAAESSVGTFTDIKTMNEHVFTHYRARVYEVIEVGENAGFVRIAYPYQHFDVKNVVQFFASVMGNVFGMRELDAYYVLDIALPSKYQRQFSGPTGLEHIRKWLGTHKTQRPHVGTIVKPKVGLTPKEFANVAYQAWVGGLDLVKDDENLVDQKFCTWQKRFDEVLHALDKAEKETGERKLYATNVSDVSIERMFERIEYVSAHGAKMVMLDVYAVGLSATKAVVEFAHKHKLFVHAHRAGYAAWHRSNFGVSFQVLAKFYRLLGVDQLHVGTGVGKMDGSPVFIKRLADVLRAYKLKEAMYLGALKHQWYKGVGKVLPVASGGLHPGHVHALHALFGNDVLIQAGGGVHGHPNGTEEGARAMREAVEAVVQGVGNKELMKKSVAFRRALKKFSYVEPEKVERSLEFFTRNADTLNAFVKRTGLQGLRLLEKGVEPRE
jgi:ribulose-bisphosphate carboxylase large chain